MTQSSHLQVVTWPQLVSVTSFFYCPVSIPLAVSKQLSCSWVWLSIPSPFTPRPPTLLPSGSHQPALCIYESASVSSVHLYCSLHSPEKWNHMVFVFLWLAYFTSILPSRCIHDANGKISFVLGPSNIPLYIIVIFFIHLLIDRDLGASTSWLL